jgi:cyclohexyl-isocyanide hydratase
LRRSDLPRHSTGEAGRDPEHRNRTGGVEQLEAGNYQHGDHDLCPETRDTRHFRHQAAMAGWPRQVILEDVVMPEPLQIGLLLFPKVTQLDFTGPLQVFGSLPGAKVHLIWKRIEPVPSDSVLMLTPTVSFADCPQLDVICVPGGAGTDDMVNDEEMLAFLRKQAAGAKYVTSVCTGSLVLGAAGLLQGFRAVTHWTAMEYLPAFGAIPTKTRVCVDRNRITGGGVTAGIDFALTLVSHLTDRKTAEAIQLRLEYNPAPPFNSGSPDTAPPEVLALLKERIAANRQRRSDAINRAAARLSQPA